MKEHLKKVLRIVVGGLFIIVGIIGLFLPFIQGILLILIGLAIIEGKPIVKTLKEVWESIKKKFKK